jgi:hypothetical protein
MPELRSPPRLHSAALGRLNTSAGSISETTLPRFFFPTPTTSFVEKTGRTSGSSFVAKRKVCRTCYWHIDSMCSCICWRISGDADAMCSCMRCCISGDIDLTCSCISALRSSGDFAVIIFSCIPAHIADMSDDAMPAPPAGMAIPLGCIWFWGWACLWLRLVSQPASTDNASSAAAATRSERLHDFSCSIQIGTTPPAASETRRAAAGGIFSHSHASACSLAHPAAFVGAPSAGSGTFLAVLHLMLPAFVSAHVADSSTGLAQRSGCFTTPRHEPRSDTAQLGAIDIKCDAAGHHLRIVFPQARGGAHVARVRAVVTGINT